MAKIPHEELDQLAAEVLPERTVLGLAVPAALGGASAGAAGHGDTSIAAPSPGDASFGVGGQGAIGGAASAPPEIDPGGTIMTAGGGLGFTTP
jgi:hypothetical protein